MNLDLLSGTIALFSSLLLGLYLYKTTTNTKFYPVSKKRSIRGLQNLGNTCYINALLQALASSKYFTEWIMKIPIDNKMQECDSDNLSAGEVISALSFHRWNISIGYEQDLFELLNIFYTIFEEEINTIANSSNAFEKILTSSLFSKTIKEPIDTLIINPLVRNMWYKNVSFKQFPFFGSICTTISCCDKNCLHKEVKIDPVGVISLSIPHDTFLNTFSLEFLLRNYFKSETISDASCDKCIKEKNKKGSGIYKKDSFCKVSLIKLKKFIDNNILINNKLLTHKS
ncbi:Ubiquitin carboxyl-terminal hydrolase 30 [Strongyloides ratti]|uniref:ubiquitinyl hydrolase 1 n=1 Tax=Strongyloides ratti TaxID=34506 RepID=A0A090LK88_STRRB|nr:Ubiquitin carboxyl-terminal hydrolase 30 [Strongyloides ratti]CEF67965.1 Ubiquitin carboxyl-terminal hydrolase 30 [Strongyloides ratti]